jgi:Na+/proline symporter
MNFFPQQKSASLIGFANSSPLAGLMPMLIFIVIIFWTFVWPGIAIHLMTARPPKGKKKSSGKYYLGLFMILIWISPLVFLGYQLVKPVNINRNTLS